MKVIIRPASIGPDVTLEVNPINKQHGLAYAAATFAKLIGLIVTDMHENDDCLRFTIGTGITFFAMEARDA
jgi:hypothetical protein